MFPYIYSQLLQSWKTSTFSFTFFLLNHGNKSVEIKNNEQPTYVWKKKKVKWKTWKRKNMKFKWNQENFIRWAKKKRKLMDFSCCFWVKGLEKLKVIISFSFFLFVAVHFYFMAYRTREQQTIQEKKWLK